MKSKANLNLIESDSSFYKLNNTFNGRIRYIIKILLDSDYYYDKKLDPNQIKNKENLNLNKMNNQENCQTTLNTPIQSLNLSREKFENNLKKVNEKLEKYNFQNSYVIFHTNAKGKSPYIIYEKIFFENDEKEFILFEELFYYYNFHYSLI